MKAINCDEWGMPHTLKLKDLQLAAPAAGEVQVEVHAAGVNFPDVLIIQKKYQVQPPLPFVPGAELAGVVTALGEGVTHLKVGDKVVSFCGTGAFATHANVSAAVTAPLAPGMSFDLGAAFTLTYGTSWHAVRDRAALKEGETMLVLGAAGGVGLAAVEIGKAIGARVIAAASSDEKLAVCKAHGADVLINYQTQDLREAIKAACGGKGPDVIYDPVGGPMAEAAFRSIGWRGRYLVVGFAAGEIPALPWNLALLKGASIMGVFWGEFAKREPKANFAGIKEMLGWMQEGKIRPLVSKTYALADTPQALIDLHERRATGKLVIRTQE
jgi:NADPH:quinone reductase